MKDFVICTDACSDLGKDIREKYSIDYFQNMLYMGDKETFTDLDWKEFSPEEYYKSLADGVICKTSQVNVEQYREGFEKYAKNGKDILCLVCSSGLSQSINSSMIAKAEVLEKYPDAKIYCIDTLRASLGLGLIVVYAARMKEQGKSIDEIAAWVEENKLNFHQVGTVEDLIYLKRAGRITGAKAFMGKLLNIKPLIISDALGHNASASSTKGRKASLKALLEYTEENIIDPENQPIFIVNAVCLEEALYLKSELETRLGCKEFYINHVGPTIGATVGAGMIAIYFYGKKVTKIIE